MDKIRINNLKFFTKNGVLAEEKRLGQQVEIDLEMQLSLAEAGRTDDVTQTVNSPKKSVADATLFFEYTSYTI